MGRNNIIQQETTESLMKLTKRQHERIQETDKLYPSILLRESEPRNEIVENTELDPDSEEAWWQIDETGPDSEIVRVGDFTWHRQKSNENVTDDGDGKGFSFFYARYAFEDEKRRKVPVQGGRNRTIGRINKDVYTVIDTIDENNLTRIISAWAITDRQSKWIRYYYQGGKRTTESIKEHGEPIYPGANDELSETYFQKAMNENT